MLFEVITLGGRSVLLDDLIEATFEVPIAEGSFRFERPWAALLIPGALLALAARGWIHERRARNNFV